MCLSSPHCVLSMTNKLFSISVAADFGEVFFGNPWCWHQKRHPKILLWPLETLWPCALHLRDAVQASWASGRGRHDKWAHGFIWRGFNATHIAQSGRYHAPSNKTKRLILSTIANLLMWNVTIELIELVSGYKTWVHPKLPNKERPCCILLHAHCSSFAFGSSQICEDLQEFTRISKLAQWWILCWGGCTYFWRHQKHIP